jgi:lysozyme
MKPSVIDISHHQADPIDFVAAWHDGVIGVILKATEGESYVDETFHQRFRDASDAGLFVSSYHFMRPGDIEQQMRHYLNTVQSEPSERVCLDFEDPDSTFAELEHAAAILLDCGLEVAVYGSNVLVEKCQGQQSAILERTSLWQARYSDNEPEPPGIWPVWSLWQYTDCANVAGFNDPIDGNVFNGSDESLKKWFYTDYEPTAPELSVSISIIAPPGIDIIVNGQIIRPHYPWEK